MFVSFEKHFLVLDKKKKIIPQRCHLPKSINDPSLIISLNKRGKNAKMKNYT